MALRSSSTPARRWRSWPSSARKVERSGVTSWPRCSGRMPISRRRTAPSGERCRRFAQRRATRSWWIARGWRSPATESGSMSRSWSGWRARMRGGRWRRPPPSRAARSWPASTCATARISMTGGPPGRSPIERTVMTRPGPAGHRARGRRRPGRRDRVRVPPPGPRPARRGRARQAHGSAGPLRRSGGRLAPVPIVCRDPRSGARRRAARVDDGAIRSDPGRRRAADCDDVARRCRDAVHPRRCPWLDGARRAG